SWSSWQVSPESGNRATNAGRNPMIGTSTPQRRIHVPCGNRAYGYPAAHRGLSFTPDQEGPFQGRWGMRRIESSDVVRLVARVGARRMGDAGLPVALARASAGSSDRSRDGSVRRDIG